MKYNIYLYNRDFSERIQPAGLVFNLNSMNWQALGGCGQASMTSRMVGKDEQALPLWEMINNLRCPIEIQDESGLAVWWGLVYEVRVRVKAVEIAASLDTMSNKVAVAYSFIAPGVNEVGQRKTTAWVSDTESLAEFGIKELLASASGLSDAAALQKRNRILAAMRYPQGVQQAGSWGMPDASAGLSGAVNSASATLYCRGWFEPLKWRYASIPYSGYVSYIAPTATWQNVGDAAGSTKCFQQILIGKYTMNALATGVLAQKEGSPADNLVISLFALDNSGLPTGTLLATGSITGSGVGAAGSPTWLSLTLTPTVNLTAGVLYGLVVSRSGALDAVNYYQVNVNTGLGYTDGFFRVWDGYGWGARGTDADLCFGLSGDDLLDTTWIINDLAMRYGQYITAVDIDGASGQTTPAYRNGEMTAWDEIVELLNIGTINDRRLLAEVDISRRLHIWEEPANTIVNWYQDKSGKVTNPMGGAARPGPGIAGTWCRLRDVMPMVVDLEHLIDPGLFIIESAQYNGTAELAVTPRGALTVYDLLKVRG